MLMLTQISSSLSFLSVGSEEHTEALTYIYFYISFPIMLSLLATLMIGRDCLCCVIYFLPLSFFLRFQRLKMNSKVVVLKWWIAKTARGMPNSCMQLFVDQE